MNVLEEFRAAMPWWWPAVDEWLACHPAWFRNDPSWAALVYLLGSPTMVALGSSSLYCVAEGWIDWDTLLARAEVGSTVQSVIAQAAHHLAQQDPGPALGLMLVFPGVEEFRWGHAAGTIFEVLAARRRLSRC